MSAVGGHRAAAAPRTEAAVRAHARTGADADVGDCMKAGKVRHGPGLAVGLGTRDPSPHGPGRGRGPDRPLTGSIQAKAGGRGRPSQGPIGERSGGWVES